MKAIRSLEGISRTEAYSSRRGRRHGHAMRDFRQARTSFMSLVRKLRNEGKEPAIHGIIAVQNGLAERRRPVPEMCASGLA